MFLATKLDNFEANSREFLKNARENYLCIITCVIVGKTTSLT